MAGWQAGLLVLVQSVLQHMHVVLPANTAANNLQTGYQLVQMHRSWAACKHSCKQFANRSSQELGCCV